MEYKEKITALSTLGIIVSCCYLFGYWGAFNINILELGSLTDLAKLAIFPLLTGLMFFLAGTLVSEVLDRKNFPPGGGNNTRIGKFGRKYGRQLVAGQIVLTVVVANFGPEPVKWIIVAFLITLFAIPLSHVDFIIDRLPDPKSRPRILYWLLLLPAAAFGYGRIDAYQTKAGHATRVVDVTRSNLSLKTTDKKKVAYLGFAGGFHVLYETATESVILSKHKDDSILVIERNNEGMPLGMPIEKEKAVPPARPPKPSATADTPSANKQNKTTHE